MSGEKTTREAKKSVLPEAALKNLEEVYKDLHAHPELGFHEVRTAGIVADRLRSLGFEVTEKVGKTGVVGILERGKGTTVLLRADMDALPVKEETGLPYASKMMFTQEDGAQVPVMHACGHDMHTTALLGACEALSKDESWNGKIMAVFQPNEEQGAGADAMINDGLFERFGDPEIVLGQHVSPMPAGVIGFKPGPAFANSDALLVKIHGEGGHGSRPEATVDPVVLASSIVMRLQTVVSRELAAGDVAVLTVGSIRSGEVANIIPSEAELKISLRTFTPVARETALAAIKRIVEGECAAAGAKRPPEIETLYSFPAVVNDENAGQVTVDAFRAAMPGVLVVDPGAVTGSEDVGLFARVANVPCVYWLLGGADPDTFEGATTPQEIIEIMANTPSNHSPLYAPALEPTLRIGITALTTAALTWLNAG